MLDRNLTIPLLSAALLLNASAAVSPATTTSQSAAQAPVNAGPGARSDIFQQLVQRHDEALRDVYEWLKRVQPDDPHAGSIAGRFLTIRVEHRFKSLSRYHASQLAASGADVDAVPFWREIESDWLGLIAAVRRWEDGRLDHPRSPEPWTELGHYFHHHGPAVAMISCFEKGLALNPFNAELNRQYATAVFLFRKDARELYELDEQGVFNRAIRYFRKALLCEPDNFDIARDLASSYSVIKPLRPGDALAAWNRALGIAQNPLEREDARLNLARIETRAGHFGKARGHLLLVTSDVNTGLRSRVERTLALAEQRAHSP